MGTIQKISQSPEWVNSFVDAFSTGFQKEIEREAEVNVKTLPKVVWNDNTFYAALDSENSTADIFNEYGNVVTALKDVSSIEDIEKCLNKKIVAELVNSEKPKIAADDLKKSRLERSLSKIVKSSLDDELPNIAQQLGLSASASIQEVEKSVMQKLAEDNQSINTNNDQSTQPRQDDQQNQQQEQNQADIANESTTTAKIYPNKMLIARLNQMDKKVKKAQSELNIYKKNFTKLAQSFNQLSNIVNSLAESMYARKDPGNVYDIGAEQAEIDHFNETAKRSAKEIVIEHNTDLTTSQGRASLQDRILREIDMIELPEEILSEQTMSSPLMNVVQPLQPIQPVQQVKVEINVPDQSDNVEIVDDKKDDTKDAELAEVEIPDEEDVEVRKLNEKSAALFKKQICPHCHSKALRLGMKTVSVQDVNCKSCNSHFGVDLINENIFEK